MKTMMTSIEIEFDDVTRMDDENEEMDDDG